MTLSVLALLTFAAPRAEAAESHAPGRSVYRAPQAAVAPVIDGVADDPAWANAAWRAIDHQYNHNAFAYHLSLDNQAIDIGTDKKPRNYSHHVQSQWRQYPDKLVWEVAIDIYPDTYRDDAPDNEPVKLTAGKVMGFMVAYCDNDGSEIRENFIGSEVVADGPKDRGWIDAGIFGALILDGPP